MAKQDTTIGKTELAEQIASQMTGISQRQVAQVLDVLTETVTNTLQQGKSVALTGFGTFKPAERQERQGVNLHTREPMTIPARRIAQFTPGTRLKEAMQAQGFAPRTSTARAGTTGRSGSTRGQTHYASAPVPAAGNQGDTPGGSAGGGYAQERAAGTQLENAPGGAATTGQASAGKRQRGRKAGETTS